MVVELHGRTKETVINYFRMTRDPEVCRFLPQKAATEEEALTDFERTSLTGATSFGQTIYCNGKHIGDIWCYCIQRDEPNAMVSYCIFEKEYWNKGIATRALELFLPEIIDRFELRSVGAFTYSENIASVHVLRKNGFVDSETFLEEGVESKYFHKEW